MKGDNMKQKLLAIVVITSLVMSMVACGSTQAQPVQESTSELKAEAKVSPAEEPNVETPSVTAEPKVEEPKEKEESVTEPTTETTEISDIINGIDFSSFNSGESDLDTIIEEQVTYDTLIVIWMDEKEHIVKGMLSDGDSLVVDWHKDTCRLRYYAPKDWERVEQIGEGAFFPAMKSSKSVADWVSYVIPLETGDNIPLGVNVTYKDGTEESLTLNATIK